jgi:ubiquinone/menaquinone biosynthesis C-methylase UbiE
MTLDDCITLIKDGVPDSSGIWADMGSGRGAFTRALAEILNPDSEIYSIEKNKTALQQQEKSFYELHPSLTVHFIHEDFTGPITSPALDGILMANSLHFIRDKASLLRRLGQYLKTGGRFILVEYNIERSSTWVPYPISFPEWQEKSSGWGFINTRLLATRPSRYYREIYSALSSKTGSD